MVALSQKKSPKQRSAAQSFFYSSRWEHQPYFWTCGSVYMIYIVSYHAIMCEFFVVTGLTTSVVQRSTSVCSKKRTRWVLMDVRTRSTCEVQLLQNAYASSEISSPTRISGILT